MDVEMLAEAIAEAPGAALQPEQARQMAEMAMQRMAAKRRLVDGGEQQPPADSAVLADGDIREVIAQAQKMQKEALLAMQQGAMQPAAEAAAGAAQQQRESPVPPPP